MMKSDSETISEWLSWAHKTGLDPVCKLAFLFDGHEWEAVERHGGAWVVPLGGDERWVCHSLDALLEACKSWFEEHRDAPRERAGS